jgi:hypothetical protein
VVPLKTSHDSFLESFTEQVEIVAPATESNSCFHKHKCGVAAACSQLAAVQTAFAIRFLAEFE